MKNGFFSGGLSLDYTPTRIISLVPSQTELLFDLGLDDKVVGITKFCVHPQQWFANKSRVGGTKTVDMSKVKELRPDFIIANKEENVKEQIEELSTIAPVWVSDIETLESALDMIMQVGYFTATEAIASNIIKEIHKGFEAIRAATSGTAAYFIWRNPWMCAGSATFVDDLMQKNGLVNIFSDMPRYPETTLEEIAHREPDWILLSSEPFPFSQKHREEVQKIIPKAKILLVDGEMFSWYGSRLKHATDYFKNMPWRLGNKPTP